MNSSTTTMARAITGMKGPRPDPSREATGVERQVEAQGPERSTGSPHEALERPRLRELVDGDHDRDRQDDPPSGGVDGTTAGRPRPAPGAPDRLSDPSTRGHSGAESAEAAALYSTRSRAQGIALSRSLGSPRRRPRRCRTCGDRSSAGSISSMAAGLCASARSVASTARVSPRRTPRRTARRPARGPRQRVGLGPQPRPAPPGSPAPRRVLSLLSRNFGSNGDLVSAFFRGPPSWTMAAVAFVAGLVTGPS